MFRTSELFDEKQLVMYYRASYLPFSTTWYTYLFSRILVCAWMEISFVGFYFVLKYVKYNTDRTLSDILFGCVLPIAFF